MNAAERPMQTTRDWYETTRRNARQQAGPRIDRGLPHHPDGSGLAPCPRCGHEGCSLCDGSTYIADGHRDPLLRMRYARQRRIRQRDPGAYAHLRRLCAVPCWQLRLIESAVGCELAARRAVTAWREIA